MTRSAAGIRQDPDPSTNDRRLGRSPFRVDIQGLRAIAVLGVVVFHAAPLALPGGFVGVDVFFVISGFLITNHLAAQLSATGRISFGDFYARRIRRILPASFVVLVATAVVCVFVVPPVLLPAVLHDAAATAAYVPNVRFAVLGTDYLAETAPSPFQHYWSLGVEEQFYLLWPLVLVLLWRLARGRSRVVVGAVIALVALSLALAILLTFRSPAWAFFSLPTRAWELGAGAAVALAAPAITRALRGVAAPIAGWSGLAGIVASMIVLNSSTAFRGFAAILPVAATALVIAAGIGDHRRGPARLLRLRPFGYVGRVSYSLYLVHWPLVVVPALASIEGSIPLEARVALAVAALPLAGILYRFVERPFQVGTWAPLRRPRPVIAGAIGVAVVLGASGVAGAVAVASAPVPVSAAIDDSGGPTDPPVFADAVPANLVPSLGDAADDIPTTYSEGCHLAQPATDFPLCRYGDQDADVVVALFGDSHAAQWFPALDRLADEEGFRLDVYTRSSCPSVLLTMVTDGVADTGCDAWRERVIGVLNDSPPDRILLSNFSRYPAYGTTSVTEITWSAALGATLRLLPDASTVTLVLDTPEFLVTPAVCLSARPGRALDCARPREEALDEGWRQAEAATAADHGVGVVDLTGYLCTRDLCGLIVGPHLLYRDRHHLTASYAEDLRTVLWGAVIGASPRAPGG